MLLLKVFLYLVSKDTKTIYLFKNYKFLTKWNIFDKFNTACITCLFLTRYLIL